MWWSDEMMIKHKETVTLLTHTHKSSSELLDGFSINMFIRFVIAINHKSSIYVCTYNVRCLSIYSTGSRKRIWDWGGWKGSGCWWEEEIYISLMYAVINIEWSENILDSSFVRPYTRVQNPFFLQYVCLSSCFSLAFESENIPWWWNVETNSIWDFSQLVLLLVLKRPIVSGIRIVEDEFCLGLYKFNLFLVFVFGFLWHKFSQKRSIWAFSKHFSSFDFHWYSIYP